MLERPVQEAPPARRHMPPSAYCALALLLMLSAFLMAIAVAVPGYPWLAFVTLIPLFVSIRLLPPAQAAVAGAFWGASLTLIGRLFADSPIPLSVLSVLVLGAAPSGYAYVAARMTRRFGFNPVVLSLGWLAVEASLTATGLHTGLLGGAQQGTLLMSTVGQSLGYLLVAYLVVCANGLILAILTDVHLRLPGAVSLRRRYRDHGSPLRILSFEFCARAFQFACRPRAPPA